MTEASCPAPTARNGDRATPYWLVGPDGRFHPSADKGTLGGNRRSRIYGRLDCPAALRALARGGYVPHRMFFATAADAEAAGYRPCGTCLPDAYRTWKSRRGTAR